MLNDYIFDDDLDVSMYNSLILRIEDRMARIKKSKRKRFLNGVYQEIFAGKNKNSLFRNLFYELNEDRQEQFMGFFMSELKRVDLEFLATNLDKRCPNIVRVELRLNTDDILYRYVTWKRKSAVKKLSYGSQGFDVLNESANQDEISYLRERVFQEGLKYIELRIDSEIYGGKDAMSFRKLTKPSLFVREKLNELPKRYGKLNELSQIKILEEMGHEHNITSMIKEYLVDAGLDMTKLSVKEKRKFTPVLNDLKWNYKFRHCVEEYHMNNKETIPQLPHDVQKFTNSMDLLN